MRTLPALAILLLAPTVHARVTEHCPSPNDIIFADEKYRAHAQRADATWSGIPSAAGGGHVREFIDAEFHAVRATNPSMIFGFFEGCRYRLTSGTLVMKYNGGATPLKVLVPPHGWSARKGDWLYRCSRNREGCSFTTD
ncbi:hypothetical protein J2T07_003825 [Luteibacter jiangsuensis]|uniref:DUF3757 domain-containing protein n=1 Tax=Luteibacter jiangsuensis TaxID=637577 RepID=A0ABT9T2V7_9GAMM|nr:DUF3757 domain-containing protein [Luteibacter jiangsuensis]MDQ0011611.1 hypothetical protein [Luteibacter jiangsuensis]